jgi:uncharacterized protein YacL
MNPHPLLLPLLLLLPQVPEYVLARLQRVSDETDPRKRRRLAKLLALLAALLQLAGARNRLPLKPPRAAKVGRSVARLGRELAGSWQGVLLL